VTQQGAVWLVGSALGHARVDSRLGTPGGSSLAERRRDEDTKRLPQQMVKDE
jgi:hypothetical protein